MNIEELKFLLKKYNLTPNKLRGQNFLIDDSVLEEIIDTADLSPSDLVLEVGPGLGALTASLTSQVKQVLALELDKNFEQALAKIAKVSPNLEIIWQDILSLQEQQWQAILSKYGVLEYKIVANIPYYLTGKFIQKFMNFKPAPKSLTLMIQKEVAQRLVASDQKQSLLSLAVAFYGQASLAAIVPKTCFYPEPQVDSAVININNIKAWPYRVDEKFTWQLIHRGFAQKRKKLINNILTDTRLEKAKVEQAFAKLNLDKNIRAENLSTKNWLDLVALL